MTIPAAKANRRFSALLRAARNGTRVTITSHGQPVAELGPVGRTGPSDELQRERRAAFKEMQDIWAIEEPVVVGLWSRAELYERDPMPEL